jgi:hypothetical protein
MERPEGWRRAVEFVAKSDMVGDVYEFGCYRGTSLTHLYRAAVEFEPMVGKRFLDRFFAFDSFQGMPAGGGLDSLDGYNMALGTLAEGRYAVTNAEFRSVLNDNGVDLSRLHIVEGFYEDSLVRPSTIAACGQSRCALLHIDCDFEVSATAALEFMTSRLQDGAVVLFDDWFLFRGRPDRGVQAAFARWLPRSGYEATHYFNYSWVSAAFILHQREALTHPTPPP